ncbi:hypothetical protein OB13_20375 [Pontibacter sp. HJ8]
MNKNNTNTGGAAFPFITEETYSVGMSLRDYYAAHAPAVPDWFTVEYSKAPARPHSVLAHFSGHEHSRLVQYFFSEATCEWTDDSEGQVPEGFRQEVRGYARQWKAAQEAYQAQVYESHIRRLVQWRFFYADQMLNSR